MFSLGIASFGLASSALAVQINLSSYSIDDLRYLVKQINTRIAELEKEKTKVCFVSNSDLSLGDGEAGVLLEDVRKLQDFLREKGYLSSKSTGYFGKLTRNALMAYQKAVGSNQTGEFDSATREKIHASQCSSSSIVQKGDEERMKMDKEKQAMMERERMEKEKKMMEVKKYEEQKKQEYYPSSTVSSIEAQASGKVISWRSNGMSKYGYKVVWSKTESPVYPPKDNTRAQFYEASASRAEWLDAFDKTGTYYVRVCEYLNGTCGVYSNEVKVEL